MSEWFHAKVSFLRQMDNGLVKQISEQYLVDSMSFTECEARVISEQGDGVREVTVKAIARSDIKELVFYGDTDLWFKVKVQYSLMNEETEKEQKVTTYFLVNANDAKEAYERTFEHLKEMLVPFTITQISESPIIEVYQYQAGLRPGLRKVASNPVITDGSNGTAIAGDGTVLKVGGEFEMDEFDAEEWYEGLPDPMKQELVDAFNKGRAETWLKAYDTALDDDCIADIVSWLQESAEHEAVIDCAYTKRDKVGRSYDDEKPQHESPFDRGGFPTVPTPLDLSGNGLDSIKKPPFGESPKPDPTNGQAVDFEIDPLWKFMADLGVTLLESQQHEVYHMHESCGMVEFVEWLQSEHDMDIVDAGKVYQFLEGESKE